MTTTNQQVKLLMKNLKKHSQKVSAAKAGMDVKTARKYIKSGELPSEMKKSYERDQPNVFDEHWDEITQMLTHSPTLQAKTIFDYLLRQYPDHYQASQLRTLQRHIQKWRASYGASKAVIFRQHIQPGKQSQSDFTCMNLLNITINGEEFKHLLFHFMLPYSRWESVSLCFSESFETLTYGYEKAVWELGSVVKEHRTDNLTAATQAIGSRREFTTRWQQFMAHYKVTPTTNNAGVSHENGSVEKSHDTLKNAIEQALLLRGSTDFPNQKNYLAFVETIVASRNIQRKERLLEEIPDFKELPDKKWYAPDVMTVRVSTGSTIQLLGIPYTVPSRLIHYTLTAYIFHNEIILYYQNQKLQTMPRIHGASLAGINYRHIIDSLIRKPGAFAHYQYHQAMFPRLGFRKAYDALRQSIPATADKDYLKILQLAKLHSEQEVTDALELLLQESQCPTANAVKQLMDAYRKQSTPVNVFNANLSEYDDLLIGNYSQETH